MQFFGDGDLHEEGARENAEAFDGLPAVGPQSAREQPKQPCGQGQQREPRGHGPLQRALLRREEAVDCAREGPLHDCEHVVEGAAGVAHLHEEGVLRRGAELRAEGGEGRPAQGLDGLQEEGVGLGEAAVHHPVQHRPAVDAPVQRPRVQVRILAKIEVEHLIFHSLIVLEKCG